ncbi:MAG TPA: thiamine pyrophosphate-binding protein [Bacteroidales bacterium]|nr:thiamine pyrophosphate-binding protein [Bacteroidales bacterium]
MTVAECIAEELGKRGVRYLFGIPGGPSIPYLVELKRQGIEFILTANETAAGIMADVTGRITGLPGVCHATFGPGATNLSTGVGGALLDRSPLIALTTEVPDNMRKRTIQMNIDHQLLFEPVTKATVRLSPRNCIDIMTDAFDLAESEYPGPVHIGLPSDIANRKIGKPSNSYLTEEWDQETYVDSEVAALLEYSKKPVLAVGLTASRHSMGPEIKQFLDQHPMPVLLTPMAKGLIPRDHEYYAGVLFHAMSDKLTGLIEESDLVIGFGYDPVEYNYESWLPDIPLIHINTIPSDMPPGIMVKQVHGRLEGILEMLSPALNKESKWNFKHLSEIRIIMQSSLETRKRSFGPVKMLKTLREVCPPETILTLDVGSHIHLFGQFWDVPSKEKLIMTNGWSGMGFGIPSAIAAKLNKPECPVVCVTGDGGFLMMSGEIITARRLGINIVIVVLSDGELNLIKLKQQKWELEPYGISLYNGDLFGAEIFLGIPVLNVNSITGMRISVKRALNSKGPVIINAVIDPSEYQDLIVV